MLEELTKPAFLRDGAGTLIYANPAYHELAGTLGRRGTDTRPAEILDIAVLSQHGGHVIDAPGEDPGAVRGLTLTAILNSISRPGNTVVAI